MFTNQIAKVLRCALNTFPTVGIRCPELFEEKLNRLKISLDKTTASDIGFHVKYMNDEFWEKENQAPIGYMDIYEDENVTLGVFILKPGMKMPLHDHPHMHGLLKVIAGQVRIHSYNVVGEEDYVLSPETLQTGTITAQKNPILTVNAQSDSILLQPKLGNLHEIVCDKESTAAFIDVLSPPYDTIIQVDKSSLPRKCRYFEIIEQLKDDFVKLKTCSSPAWFVMSKESYLGPNVMEFIDGDTGHNVVESETGDSASSKNDSDSKSYYSNSNDTILK